MAPKVKNVFRSSETETDPKPNKSSIENSKNEKNRSDWTETGTFSWLNNTVNNSSKVKSRKDLSKKEIFPSQSGSTRCPDDRKAKYTPKYYRRRLKYCKTLLRILIAAKTETCMKQYIDKSLGIIDENYKNNFRKNRSVQTNDLEDEDHPEVIDENRNVRSFKPDGKKIPDRKSLPSANKLQCDQRDQQSMIRWSTSPQREIHDHQNAENQSLSDSSDDVTIIETGKK